MRDGLIERPDPEARERRVAGLLFFATCCSVFAVRLLRWEEGPVWTDPGAFGRAMAFTLTLMGILLAHELGHYAVARRHGFRLSLPWFIPVPLFLGTLGAIIGIRETPRTRTGLLEMGAAGPLAGLAATVLALAVRVGMGPAVLPATAEVRLGVPLLFRMIDGVAPGAGVGAVHPGDPIAFAAWIGCLVTAMNLLPFGQLDGGHITSALIPEHASLVTWGVTAILLVAGLMWPGWAVWAAFLHLIGARYAVTVRRAREEPSVRARWVAVAAGSAFVVCFTAIPFELV